MARMVAGDTRMAEVIITAAVGMKAGTFTAVVIFMGEALTEAEAFFMAAVGMRAGTFMAVVIFIEEALMEAEAFFMAAHGVTARI